MFYSKSLATILVVQSLCLGVFSTSIAQAVEIYSENGHGYDLVSSSAGWTSAKCEAESRIPPLGFSSGHLVTYTDNAEEDFVQNAFGNTLNGKWIGFTDTASEGTWRWIDDTAGIWQDPDNFPNPIQTAHTNWRSSTSEPNSKGNEDFVVYSTFNAPSPQWNDLLNSTGFFNGYVVEFEPPIDSDNDMIFDHEDNCRLISNADQRDTNGDGIGNICDADLNNDCIVNAIDLGQLRSVFFTSDSDADFDGNGVVNVVDLGLMKTRFFGVPGPSGIASCTCN